jgi:hypothetical protein
LPIKDKEKTKKVKPTKTNTKPTSNDKKKSSETKPLTPPPVKEVPIKRQSTTTTSAPPPPSPPPSSTNSKSKREKPPPVFIEPTEALDVNESDDIDNDEKNNSVVGRAYHFVKNMFQLSDDILENNHTHEEDEILSSTNEQQHHQSRKLLSTNNDYEFKLYLNELNDQQSFLSTNDLLYSAVSLSKRQLLTVKTSKRSIPSKEKKTTLDKSKPKVGWNYRYRISRYLADQKMKRTGNTNRALGGGKAKQQQQQFDSKQSNKKISSSSNTKISKRKLLELDIDDESNLGYHDM